MRPHDFTGTSRNVVQAFDDIFGQHPGFRPTHAKGILLDGSFTPSAEAVSLTRAPHIANPVTPVTVRFSNFGGIPAIPDTDPRSRAARNRDSLSPRRAHSHRHRRPLNKR